MCARVSICVFGAGVIVTLCVRVESATESARGRASWAAHTVVCLYGMVCLSDRITAGAIVVVVVVVAADAAAASVAVALGTWCTSSSAVVCRVPCVCGGYTHNVGNDSQKKTGGIGNI